MSNNITLMRAGNGESAQYSGPSKPAAQHGALCPRELMEIFMIEQLGIIPGLRRVRKDRLAQHDPEGASTSRSSPPEAG